MHERNAVGLAATGDVHSPRHLPGFLSSLSVVNVKPRLVLLAGDIIDRGRWGECTRVVNPVAEKWPDTPILAVYGNEEYDEVKEKVRSTCSKARWLDDEYVSLSIGELRIGVVGTRGVLDRPTPWQARHIPGIVEIYRRRLQRIRELAAASRRVDDVTILLTHYPPRAATLEGEDPRFWPQMSSARLSRVVEETGIDVVVHGHLHKSRVHTASLGGAKVYNVAFPAVKSIAVIRVDARRGILDFLE